MPPASTDAGAASRRSRSASLTGAPVGLRSGVQQAGGSHGCAPPTPANGIGGALGIRKSLKIHAEYTDKLADALESRDILMSVK